MRCHLARYVSAIAEKKPFEAVFLRGSHLARTMFGYTAELRRLFPSTAISSRVSPQDALLGYGMYVDAEEKIRSELVRTFENYALTMPDLAEQAGRVVEELRRGNFTFEYLLALRDISKMLCNPETQLIGKGLLNLMFVSGIDGEILCLLSFPEMVERSRQDMSPWTGFLQSIFEKLIHHGGVERAEEFLVSEILKAQGLKVEPDNLGDILLEDDSPFKHGLHEIWIRARIDSILVLLSNGQQKIAERILRYAGEYEGEVYQVDSEITDPSFRVESSGTYTDILLHMSAQLSSTGRLAGIRRSLFEKALDILEHDKIRFYAGSYAVEGNFAATLSNMVSDRSLFSEAAEAQLEPLLDPSEKQWLNAADESGENLDKYWEGYLQRSSERKGGGSPRGTSGRANRRAARARVRGAGRRAAGMIRRGGAVFAGARAVRHVV